LLSGNAERSVTQLQKPVLAATFGADALDEGVASSEDGIVLDARIERLAFEDVPCTWW
jgi:hypothetical protein